MTGWAATSTLREALAIAWPEGDHPEPNVFTEALAKLALVEAALDAAEGVMTQMDYETPHHSRLAAALRAVREGT